jgi:hypothetical protein
LALDAPQRADADVAGMDRHHDDRPVAKAPLLVRSILVHDTGLRIQTPDPSDHLARPHGSGVNLLDSSC